MVTGGQYDVDLTVEDPHGKILYKVRYLISTLLTIFVYYMKMWIENAPVLLHDCVNTILVINQYISLQLIESVNAGPEEAVRQHQLQDGLARRVQGWPVLLIILIFLKNRNQRSNITFSIIKTHSKR